MTEQDSDDDISESGCGGDISFDKGISNCKAQKYVPVPEDLIEDPRGVYGYLPVEGSQFHSKNWPVDWTDEDQVSIAREKRLEYHHELEKKKKLVEDLRQSGESNESIARKLVGIRNKDRLSHYKTPEDLERVYERNLKKYGNKNGPTYESQLYKYGTPEEVISAALRTNDTMDILTGISKPLKPKL